MGSNKVLKAGLGYTIGNILLKGINFLTIPIFTRLLAVSDYGLFNIYTVFESILYIFIGLCLHTSLKNAKYDYEKNYKEYISSIILLSLCSFFAFLVVLNIAYPLYKELLGFNRLVLNILVFHSYGSAMITFYNQKIALDYEYKKFLKVSFVNILLNLLLSLILIFTVFSNSRYMARIIGTALPIILIGIILIIHYFRESKPKYRKEYWKYSVKISVFLIPHGVSQVILSQFDRIMIRQYISDTAVGIYSFAFNVSSILSTIYSSLETVWTTWFFEKMQKKEYVTIKKNYKKYVYCITILCSLLMLGSHEIVKILADKEYWTGIHCTFPLLFATYFTFIYTLPASMEYYLKKNQYIAIGTTMAAIINLILNAVFIPRYGYVAAAYTTLISYAIYFIFHYCIYSKITQQKIFSILLFIKNIVFLIIIWVISSVWMEYMLIRILIAILIIIVFFIWMIKAKD